MSAPTTQPTLCPTRGNALPEIKIRDPLELQIKSTATSAATAKNMLPYPPAEHSVKKLDIKETPVILPRVKEAVPIRTKADLFDLNTEESSTEAQSAEQIQQAASITSAETLRFLANTSLKPTKCASSHMYTPADASTSGDTDSDSLPLKLRGEGTTYEVRTKPSAQTEVRTAPNIVKTEAYVEAKNTRTAKSQDHIKKHQQQERAAARKEYIKNVSTNINNVSVENPKKIASAISRTAKAIFNAMTGITGAGAILILLCAVILAAAIAASPMGILFADEASESTLMEAIAEISAEYNAELQSYQSGTYSRIENIGQPPSWRDVVAVFACKTAWATDGLDVITLDSKRMDRLRAVFWDMTDISSSIETVEHEDTNPEDEIDDSYTETILTVTTSAKTAEDMRTEYNFSKQQNEALDLLLEELEEWGIFLSDLDISDPGALVLWDRLPENLSTERRMVVQYALSLVGKVNYFWGGKSLVLGWDTRWGTPTVVSAAGSPTTGTSRPYGMDCSGFVDWVFYNVSGGSYVIGRGGGCISQHNNCYAISWSEAQPGDLVFYPEDMHIGIVGGWDANGNIQIIHCASGSLNGVVITGKSGFTSIAQPYYFSDD